MQQSFLSLEVITILSYSEYEWSYVVLPQIVLVQLDLSGLRTICQAHALNRFSLHTSSMIALLIRTLPVQLNVSDRLLALF